MARIRTIRFGRLAVLAAAFALTAACSSSTRVDAAWAEDVSRNQSFEKVLVVGVSPAYNTR
jgi:hypothetical protein